MAAMQFHCYFRNSELKKAKSDKEIDPIQLFAVFGIRVSGYHLGVKGMWARISGTIRQVFNELISLKIN